jgi:hypothetical protein
MANSPPRPALRARQGHDVVSVYGQDLTRSGQLVNKLARVGTDNLLRFLVDDEVCNYIRQSKSAQFMQFS